MNLNKKKNFMFGRKSIEERKTICLKVMNDNEDSNPIAAFQAGNCLLYSGYSGVVYRLYHN